MRSNNIINYIPVGMVSITMLAGATLAVTNVKADDVVDQVNITVPVSCSMTGIGMDSHEDEVPNGTYQADIGTTTIHAFCNDANGFALYSVGFTDDEYGKNVLSNATLGSTYDIVTGTATSAGAEDISNWAMKLAITQDSGETTGTDAFTLDSDAEGSFGSYHTVPSEYTKVAHKESGTDMTENTGGVKLTTTYAAYISKTQPAGTYTGQVKYTLVHPSTNAPVEPGKVAVNYNGNGNTFANGESNNRVVYAASPVYIATTPLISKTDNISDDGTQNGSYPVSTGLPTPIPITASGATKMKVVLRYGFSEGTMMAVIEGNWDGSSEPGKYEMLEGPSTGTETYIFDGDAVTFYMMAERAPTATGGLDYGYFAQVYPVYTTEQEGTEASHEFAAISTDTGAYATTTDWYGSWYADINGTHYDFVDEAEVKVFLGQNLSTLSGTTVELMRGLTFDEAYTRVGRTQDSGYYKQQELTKSMCNTIAITQNETLKDVRDNNTYMVGRLKDGNCWMLENLALDPTDSATAANMNESNTNATAAAINNLLNGGSTTTGWGNVAVVDVDTGFDSYTAPRINNASKDTLVTSYGPASTNGQAKVGIYYNYCVASASTYCYEQGQGVDVPDTLIDAPQDICPANWRMPTGGNIGEYYALAHKYGGNATNTNSLQYNLSTPLSGTYGDSRMGEQGSDGFWWSSTHRANGLIDYLEVVPTGVVIGGSCARHFGMSMRCLISE